MRVSGTQARCPWEVDVDFLARISFVPSDIEDDVSQKIGAALKVLEVLGPLKWFVQVTVTKVSELHSAPGIASVPSDPRRKTKPRYSTTESGKSRFLVVIRAADEKYDHSGETVDSWNNINTGKIKKIIQDDNLCVYDAIFFAQTFIYEWKPWNYWPRKQFYDQLEKEKPWALVRETIKIETLRGFYSEQCSEGACIRKNVL